MRSADTCAVGGEPLTLERPVFYASNGGLRCEFHDQLVSAGEAEVARLREAEAAGIVQYEVHDD